MHEQRRLLCAPLNEQGIVDLDNDTPSENVLYISFPKNEYEYMMNQTNLFDEINIKCNLLIDDYEEDTIQTEHISIVEEIIKSHQSRIPTFIKVLKIAKECETYLEVVL